MSMFIKSMFTREKSVANSYAYPSDGPRKHLQFVASSWEEVPEEWMPTDDESMNSYSRTEDYMATDESMDRFSRKLDQIFSQCKRSFARQSEAKSEFTK